MVVRTSRPDADEKGRGKRQRPGKPAATPDQSGENTQDMAYDNGNKSGDAMYRDADFTSSEPQPTKRRGRKGRNEAQENDRAGDVAEENPKRPERVFLTIKQVSQITGLCSSSVYAMMNRGEFPLPRVLGERRRRWDSNEFYDWMDSRPKARGDLGKWIDPAQDT